VFAAPQLSIVEIEQLVRLIDGQTLKVPMIVCTAPQTFGDARRMGFINKIENAGGTVLEGTCFYNQYAREIGEANGWVRLLSNSAKIVNILGGYGYKPALASMHDCVTAAIHGKII
jgi:predicted aconitase